MSSFPTNAPIELPDIRSIKIATPTRDLDPNRRRNSDRPQTAEMEPPSEKNPFGFQNYLSELDIHGIGSLLKADQLIVRAIWILIMLLAAGILIFGLVENVRDYVNNPILTTYDIVAGEAIDFPHIYLCPANYINYTFVRENKVNLNWTSYFQSGGEQENETTEYNLLIKKQSFWERIGIVPVSDIDSPPILTFNSTGFYDNDGIWHTFPPLPPIPTLSTTTSTTTTSTTTVPPLAFRSLQEYFLHIGYSASEFIRECTFQGKVRKCSDIVSEYFDRDNGKCFLIDVNSVQTKPGDGLSLVLDLNTRFFHDPTLDVKPSIFDGVYMMVQKKFNPAIADKILLHPGEYTRVGLDASMIRRISGNHGGRMRYCRSDTKEFRVLNISEYTVDSCHMDCTQAEIMSKCGCILAVDSRFIRRDIQEELRSNATHADQPEDGFCTGYDVTTCVDQIRKSREEAIQNCMKSCDPQCNEWSYTSSLSHMRFPSRLMIYPLELGYSEDYLIVDVTFNRLQYIQIIQSESMTAATFVSNIGGQMGVWMGASILTLVQMLLIALSYVVQGRKR